MTARSSLDAAYFEGIFGSDDDPWNLATSAYEAGKFGETYDVLADRRYGRALEVGCAQGVLTEKLVCLCDDLLAIDISKQALARAEDRLGDQPGVTFAQMAFPRQVPEAHDFDLVILSEVAYYWDDVDLDRAAIWLADHVASGGRVILVHYIGETDYPQSGDGAVETLWTSLSNRFELVRADRRERYRLDLWARR